MNITKYVILLGDGMPDRPIAERENKTPLMMAQTPNLDFMAKNGTAGSVKTTPDGFEPGSDVTNMGILGYDPNKYYTGRSPLEATAMGVTLAPDDVAFRCNLVTLKPVPDGLVMHNFSAGHIDTETATELITDLNEAIGDETVQFYPGVSYRHLMVWRGGIDSFKLTPPHDISDDNVRKYLPKGEGADFLNNLTNEAQMFLNAHKANEKREKNGNLKANSIWLWGQGKAPVMESLQEKFGLNGAMITAVDLMRGIAKNAGMRVIDVEGATGWIDTNYEGKASACIEALDEVDLVYLHVESPDESGHAGLLDAKVTAISDFDKKVVGPVLEEAKRRGDTRVIALSDHATPLEIKTHSLELVPFAIYPPTNGGGAETFDEKIVDENDLVFDSAISLNDHFLKFGATEK